MKDLLFNAIEESVFILNDELKILEKNKSAEKLFNIKSKVKGQNINSILNLNQLCHHNGNKFQVEESPILIARKTGKAVKDVQIKAVLGSKKEVYCLIISVFPLSSDQLPPKGGYLILVKDVTERIKAISEAKLYKSVSKNATYGHLISDMNGEIIYSNRAFENLHLLNTNEAVGQSVSKFIAPESELNYRIFLRELMLNGRAENSELIHLSKIGDSFPALHIATLVSDTFNNRKLVSQMIIDLTERKLIENEIIELNLNLEEKVKRRTIELEKVLGQMKTFFDVSVDMLSIIDQNGRFIKVSKAFEDVLGYTIDEITGESFLEFVHEEDLSFSRANLSQMHEKGTFVKFTNRNKTKSGKYINIEWYCAPSESYTYAAARDVTETIENEKKLLKAIETAEEANQSKSLFLSRMSHELRTPMNSILGFAQLLEMGELNEKQEHSVQHILNSGKHLLSLINEVLDIAKIESGGYSMSIERIDILDIINEVCSLILPLSQKKNVSIEIIEPEEKFFIKADYQCTIQILTNIINNAVKYNYENGQVKIMLSKVDGFIEISIADKGIGIDKKDMDKVFEPFVRVIQSDKEHIEGTGLGLSVVKELVSALEGKISLNSVKDKGTTFQIYLPECTTQMEDLGTLTQVEKKIIRKTYNNGAKILYVEDNDLNISLVRDILNSQKPNFDLHVTMTGKPALEMAIENSVDLILLDLDLPDIHGSKILEELKSNDLTKSIPVIVVSADATEKQISNLLELGAEKYLTKPFNILELLDLLDKYIK
jgi:PAS domain S-box-containing protein